MWYSLLKQSDGGYRPSLLDHMKTKELPPGRIEEMYHAHKNDNMSVDEVSRQFGYDHNLLRKRFKERGMKTEPVNSRDYYERQIEDTLRNKAFCSKILELHNKGVSVHRMSTMPDIGLPVVVLSAVLSNIAKGTFAPHQFSQEDIALAVDLFRQNKSPNFISTSTGIPAQNITKLILKSITPNERTAYRQKILNKRGPEYKAKVDSILAFIEQNQSLKNSATKVSRQMNLPLNDTRHIMEIFVD